MNNKIKLFLIIVFLIINSTVYFLTKINSDNIIRQTLEAHQMKLQTHYDILYATQKNISIAIQKSILRNSDVKTLLNTTLSKQEQSANRAKLQSQLIEQYEASKQQGVLQLQFVDSNNISFLRMHKPDKFGDDLTDIRADFKYTNQTKKPIRAFTQGRTSHGFRNIFPIFNDNNRSIGAMELSFSSDKFEWYLNNITNMHTHFLVNKKIFDTNTWQRDDLVQIYEQSKENSTYMSSNAHLQKEKCIDKNIHKLDKTSKEIESKMALGKSFSSYVQEKGNVIIFSFLPIYDLEKNNIAWFVAYKKSSIIESTLFTSLIIRGINFCLSLLIIYFLAKQIISKQKIKKNKQKLQEQYNLFNEVLNATNNVLFITDFKSIQFSNEKFKELFENETRKKYITKDEHFNVSDLFVVADGYLHKKLLNEDETFVELFQRTKEKDKIVSIMDEYSEPKAFTIDVKILDCGKNYLVSLSDITEIKEEFLEVVKKSYLDQLTQVYNRNKFDEIFKEELNIVKRYDVPLSIALIDIDKFKEFNDTFGHLIGDEVLITVAQTLNHQVRITDTFARWGGEEFIILFKNTSLEIAIEVSNKLKDKIEENDHAIAGKVTASFGVTQYKHGDTMESIFKRCDDALYIAKKNGRNRVEFIGLD